jgi:hypothetical protein
MAAAPPLELLEFLMAFDAPVPTLALDLRQIVIEELAPCHELVLSMGPKLSLIYSSTTRVIADGLCYVGVYRHHVNLGFQEGVDLDDPQRLLRGSGKAMRHLQMKQLDDVQRPEVREFLQMTRRNAGLRRRRGDAAEVITRVKKSSRHRV